MKKDKLLIIAGILIILALLLTIILLKIEKISAQDINAQEREYDMMWTKAICNDSYCQDYEIYCKNQEVVHLKPITGAILVIDKDWQDSRPLELQELMC
jgi:predicted Holliday junction resolvase-like endonuclease